MTRRSVPTRQIANPAVSSPIFGSVLAVHFSASVEKRTAGFTLSTADQNTLAVGGRVVLSNGGGDTIEIELVTDFPDYVPDPLPGFPEIVRGSNPFGLALVDSHLYVTDGGRNGMWDVDLATGAHTMLATFPTIPNPLPIGGPVIEAVPTGIAYVDGRLLVTLFRGVPFAPGSSSVVEIDQSSGSVVHVHRRTENGNRRVADGRRIPGAPEFVWSGTVLCWTGCGAVGQRSGSATGARSPTAWAGQRRCCSALGARSLSRNC